MSKNTITQVNATRNQSTANYVADHVFLGDNDYDEMALVNVTATAAVTLTSGMLVFKTAAGTVDVNPAAANIDSVVGVLRMDGDIEIADAGTMDVNVCLRGRIAEEMIVVGGITLATLIPTTFKTLRDKLNSLGFHLTNRVENTKQDNQ